MLVGAMTSSYDTLLTKYFFNLLDDPTKWKKCLGKIYQLTHCGLVTPCINTGLNHGLLLNENKKQNKTKNQPTKQTKKPTTWSRVDLYSKGFSGIQLKANLQVLMNESVTCV